MAAAQWADTTHQLRARSQELLDKVAATASQADVHNEDMLRVRGELLNQKNRCDEAEGGRARLSATLDLQGVVIPNLQACLGAMEHTLNEGAEQRARARRSEVRRSEPPNVLGQPRQRP